MGKTFEEIIATMDCNGYAYYNDEAFFNKTNEVCYIPENADDISECYTYNDLLVLCENYIKEHELQDELKAIHLVENMYQELEWCFPETWLNEYDFD